MDKIESLKQEIETARGQLNLAVEEGLPEDVIYEKSVRLDRLIAHYLDIVEQNQ